MTEEQANQQLVAVVALDQFLNPDEAAVPQFTWKGNIAAVMELMTDARQIHLLGKEMMLQCVEEKRGNLSFHLGGKAASDGQKWTPNMEAV
ncbi:hypothetical protein FOQG_18119 [Fusarium oxysporum f. sp. raphani 54005]|uniref:Uncharacterized protein n=2 Tax=Fusarium oxysporum TaxID=5507 RepID=X0B503_FUSOX|nr:hypothetical protein FOQG_18119 [Fusarium oxysporum f. sp. raphani 54005]